MLVAAKSLRWTPFQCSWRLRALNIDGNGMLVLCERFDLVFAPVPALPESPSA